MAAVPVAVVTGGSRGIGLAVATLLAARGMRVAVLGRIADDDRDRASNRDPDPASSALALARPAVTRLGGVSHAAASNAVGRHAGYACDVGDGDAVRTVFKTIVAELGPIETLVHAAGITHSQLLLRTADADVEALVRTNLLGALHVSRAALRSMLPRRRGCIVLIGSAVGAGGNAGQVVYSATKAALLGLSRSLAKEVGPAGIRCNVVAPGLVDTAMAAALGAEQRQRLVGQTALGRIGTPQDVAEMVAFLASDAATYVTGQVVYVDGGLCI